MGHDFLAHDLLLVFMPSTTVLGGILELYMGALIVNGGFWSSVLAST